MHNGERSEDFQKKLKSRLPELLRLEALLPKLEALGARVQIEAEISYEQLRFPIHSIVLGAEDPKAPSFGLVGGVHGLERIGSQIVIAWLESLAERLTWDESLRANLSQIRLAFMPLINPVGMYLTRRSNGQGVDLMRNAPVESQGKTTFLVGGHKISSLLPWYRGDGLEAESLALCEFVTRELLCSERSIALDVHSGFGVADRLWFPYAKTTKPPKGLAQFLALKDLFDRSYKNHFYVIEPQATQYTTHGDLWDYLYDQKTEGHFLPWTLELGSWVWAKKNPLQIFSRLGAFNPIKPHRHQRILRRHFTLFEFLINATQNSKAWAELPKEDSEQLCAKAYDAWYKR